MFLVIVDAGVKGSCLTATFVIGQTTNVQRSWDIKVLMNGCPANYLGEILRQVSHLLRIIMYLQ